VEDANDFRATTAACTRVEYPNACLPLARDGGSILGEPGNLAAAGQRSPRERGPRRERSESTMTTGMEEVFSVASRYDVEV